MKPLAKVIEIFSRKEVTEMPYKGENALDIVHYLMNYRNPRTNGKTNDAEHLIIDELIRMVENNSGVVREEVFEREA